MIEYCRHKPQPKQIPLFCPCCDQETRRLSFLYFGLWGTEDGLNWDCPNRCNTLDLGVH